MQGRKDEARQKYEEAASLAKKMKFAEGVNNAKMGIKRVKA